jgi:hypothetical protein
MTREWYFQAMGQELGPLSVAELKAKVASGLIQPDTLVRKGTEGKWVFGGNVKGLFPEAPAADVPPPAPAAKPKSSATMATVPPVKPGSSHEVPVKGNSKSTPLVPVRAITIELAEDAADSNSPSLEFYDFVGFREAISPVLHDAIKQFVSDRGMTLCQLNRRALADFIKRPELASDLLITAVASFPQPVNLKSNQDGSFPLNDQEQVETATFQFTLFNSSRSAIEVHSGVFLPKSIEHRTYDTITTVHHPAIDHTGHIPIRLGKLVEDHAVRMTLDIKIPPQSSQDLVIWFYNTPKPSLLNVRGQLMLGHGSELAMSEFFTVTLHSDSPIPTT